MAEKYRPIIMPIQIKIYILTVIVTINGCSSSTTNDVADDWAGNGASRGEANIDRIKVIDRAPDNSTKQIGQGESKKAATQKYCLRLNSSKMECHPCERIDIEEILILGRQADVPAIWGRSRKVMATARFSSEVNSIVYFDQPDWISPDEKVTSPVFPLMTSASNDMLTIVGPSHFGINSQVVFHQIGDYLLYTSWFIEIDGRSEELVAEPAKIIVR